MVADIPAPLEAEGDGMAPERREMLDTFRAFMLDLADFPPPRLYAVFQMLKNRPLAETAAELGCSFQNVFFLQRTALRKMPILRALVRRVGVPRPGKARG